MFYFILILASLINSVHALATSCDDKSILSSQLSSFLLISAFYQQQHSVSRAFTNCVGDMNFPARGPGVRMMTLFLLNLIRDCELYYRLKDRL
jgi:hypothetical protein